MTTTRKPGPSAPEPNINKRLDPASATGARHTIGPQSDLTPPGSLGDSAPELRAVNATQRLTLTVPEAALILGISRALAYELVARGEVPAVKLGRRIVIPRQALEHLLGSDPGSAA